MRYAVVHSYSDRSGIVQLWGPFSLDDAKEALDKMRNDPDTQGIVEIIPLSLPGE